MPIKQLNLLKTIKFLPLFITYCLGALNTSLFINSFITLNAWEFFDKTSLHHHILISLTAAVFFLPFLLFSAISGQLADKYDKTILIRYCKLGEILLMLVVALSLYKHSIFILMTMLFLLGMISAFLETLKWSILPSLLETKELIAGNAILLAGIFLFILFGTFLSDLLFLPSGSFLLGLIFISIAFCSFAASCCIPKLGQAYPALKLNIDIWHSSRSILQHNIIKKNIFLTILGISWFCFVTVTYFSQFPIYIKTVLKAQPTISILFLFIFTIGISIGSLASNRLLKSRIHATYVPLAAIGMSLFALDLVIGSDYVQFNTAALLTVSQFVSYWTSWRVLVDILCLSICVGVYIVPLSALLQFDSELLHRGRTIACNNIINIIFMLMAIVSTNLLLLLQFSVIQIFFLIAIANLIVAVCICKLLPEALVKSFLNWIFKTLYRAEIEGLENFNKAGKRVLIIANHTSFLDTALLAALLPTRLTFALDTHVARKWWMKLLLKLVNTYPLDPTNPLAAKSLIEYLRTDKHVVIFPEGRITVTGALMKIYEGPGLIADKANAPLLPIRIDGAQYSPFSYLKGKVRIRWFPKITVTILEPRTFDLSNINNSRERRRYISNELYNIMADTMFKSSNINETLFQSLLNAKSLHGGKHIILEDIERKPMNYKTLVLSSLVLGRYMAKMTSSDAYVGLLLPNSIAAVITFFGLQAFHRIPAMLNFSAGIQKVLSACTTAKISLVFTSRKFIKLADLQPMVNALQQQGVKIVYLEDVRQKIGFFAKLIGKFISFFPQTYYHYVNKIRKDNVAELSKSPTVILFTSGSEGLPKGVALSHQNLQANRFQLIARVDFGPTDIVFNVLPMFHSFGLTSATLLPIISGICVFMYPSPLHYRIIPELCYDINATIFFATDTFLTNYAKYAHPYNFYSIRYVFAGAEKLRNETRKVWMDKFGIRIMEGYGVTEASPVVTANTAMQYKMGTVGRFLPEVRYRLISVPGITNGHRLFISGPNVMVGYLYSNQPGCIIPPPDGWHDTGDIVSLDDDGYLTIKGRAKRFAKIAGEMISLTAVEEEINMLWPSYHHAVLSQPDERKGEQIILVTNHDKAQTNLILEHFKTRGIPEISLPRRIISLSALPLLGSGKIDYQAVKAIVENQCTA